MIYAGSDYAGSPIAGAGGAPILTLIDESLAENAGAQVLTNNDPSRLSAQQFNGDGTSVGQVNLKLYFSGTPGVVTGTFDVAIQADSSGDPSGVDLASQTFNAIDLPTAPPAFGNYVMSVPTSGISGTPWIVLRSNYTSSSGLNIFIRYSSGDPAPGRAFKLSTNGGATWGSAGLDLTYQVYNYQSGSSGGGLSVGGISF